jgi:hypothetical protein
MSQGSRRPIRSDSRESERPHRDRRFELLQLVYVRDAHPALGLVRGECGTIVETLEKPHEAYLVEFIEDDGSTKAEAAFRPEQLSATPPSS